MEGHTPTSDSDLLDQVHIRKVFCLDLVCFLFSSIYIYLCHILSNNMTACMFLIKRTIYRGNGTVATFKHACHLSSWCLLTLWVPVIHVSPYSWCSLQCLYFCFNDSYYYLFYDVWELACSRSVMRTWKKSRRNFHTTSISAALMEEGICYYDLCKKWLVTIYINSRLNVSKEMSVKETNLTNGNC